MKALEFLTKLKQSRDFDCNLEYSLDEAISELEEAQLTRREWYQKGYNEAMKPKTCEGCSNLFFDEIEKVYKCSNDVSDDVGYLHGEAVIRNIKDFHCVQHQPKDNA